MAVVFSDKPKTITKIWSEINLQLTLRNAAKNLELGL